MVLMADAMAPETRTTIDAMIELLKSRGKTDIAQISMALDTDQGIIENWAKVLEKGNLVKISYEVGKMFVTPYNLTPEQETAVKAEMQTKAFSIESTVSSELLSLDNLSETLKGIKTSILAAEKLESDQMPQMRKALSQINSISEAVDQKLRSVGQTEKRANEFYDAINKRAAELAMRVSQIESTVNSKSIEDARHNIAQIMGEAADADKQIALMSKNTSDSINQLRTSMEEQMKQLHQQMDSNGRDLEAKTKEYSRLLSESERELRDRARAATSVVQESKEFEQEKEKTKSRINEVRAEFNDAYAKTREEISKSKSELDASSKALLDQVDSIKKGFGEAAMMDDAITRVKGELASIESDIAAQRREIEELLTQIHKIQSTEVQPDKKSATINSIKDMVDKAASNVSDIRNKVKNVSEGAKEIGKKEEGQQEG